MTDLHGRLAERLDFGKEFDITKGEILALADSFFRENGRDSRSFDMGKMAAVLADRWLYSHPTPLRGRWAEEGRLARRSVGAGCSGPSVIG
jgi:hypothetical protein